MIGIRSGSLRLPIISSFLSSLISFVSALFKLPVQFGKMLWWSSFRNINAVVFPFQSVDVDWPPRKDEIDDQLKDGS